MAQLLFSNVAPNLTLCCPWPLARCQPPRSREAKKYVGAFACSLHPSLPRSLSSSSLSSFTIYIICLVVSSMLSVILFFSNVLYSFALLFVLLFALLFHSLITHLD